jgi:hypothetical protein
MGIHLHYSKQLSFYGICSTSFLLTFVYATEFELFSDILQQKKLHFVMWTSLAMLKQAARGKPIVQMHLGCQTAKNK